MFCHILFEFYVGCSYEYFSYKIENMEKSKVKYLKIVENILEKVDLDDFQKKMIVEKWVKQLTYMDSRAGRNCWEYYATQLIILICGLTVPILVNINPANEIIKWVITGLGLGISISAGINQLFKLERKWLHFRVITEKLRIEGNAFLGLSSNYSVFKTHKEAYPLFSTKIDKIMLLDLAQYKELLLTNVEHVKPKTSFNHS